MIVFYPENKVVRKQEIRVVRGKQLLEDNKNVLLEEDKLPLVKHYRNAKRVTTISF